MSPLNRLGPGPGASALVSPCTDALLGTGFNIATA